MRLSPKAETRGLAGLLVLLGVLYALLFFFPQSSGDETVLVVNPCRLPIYGLTLVTSVLAIGVAFDVRRKLDSRVWFPLTLALASPLFCCVGVAKDVISYADVASVRDEGGTEYHLLAMSLFQGHSLLIGRLRRRIAFLQVYDVLVTSPWEEDFGYLDVVRPKGSGNRAQVLITPKRQVIGLPYRNEAFLAYDLNTRTAYSQACESRQAKPCIDVKALSPFLLLDPTDRLDSSDVEDLFDSKSSGRPTPMAVRPDLRNPNPEVAALARKLLADLKTHPRHP